MTETPQQPTGVDDPAATRTDAGPETHAEPGVDRQHLRNYEQLRRSTTDRKIAGVAGGLGRHLNIDPTVLRVMFVVLALFSGAGLVLYIAAWLLVPEDGQDSRSRIHVDDNTRNIVLIVIGAVAALIVIGHGWSPVGVGFFPWPLLVIGILVLVWAMNRDRASRTTTTSPSAAAPDAAPGGGTTMGTTTTATASTGYTYPGATAGAAGAPPAPPWVPVGQPPYQPPYQAPKTGKRGPKLFGFTLAAVLLALGSLGLYDAAGGSVSASAYPALALAVIGVMLVVGAFVGRAGGLIALGLVAALALAGTSVASLADRGDRLTVHPVTAATVQDGYAISSGRVYVDLSRVTDPEALVGRTIDVGAKVGEVVVVLPRGIRSDVSARIDGPGGIDMPGHSSGGIDTSVDDTYGSGTGLVHISTHLKAGHIEVRNP